MALKHYYRDGDTLTDMSAYAPRIITTQSRAEESAVGSWSVILDDPNGELDIVGHRNWFIEDDESEDEDDIIWGGFTGGQTIARMQGDAHRMIGPLARTIQVDLYDASSFLARIVMKGSDTERPAETDVERMQWLLATDEADAFGDVTTFVGLAGPVNMDAAPLRGTYFGQIISDCAEQSGKNHYAFYRKVAGVRTLTIWYARDYSSLYPSPFYLSNDPADIDQAAVDDGTAIVWPLSDDATMNRSPERQYCGCYMTGADSAGATYQHNSVTHALIAGDRMNQHRDMTAFRPLVKTLTQLKNRAVRQLVDVQDQDVRVKTTIYSVPSERVTLVKAGMWLKIKGTHWWPDNEDWHMARVLTAEPTPFGPGRVWNIPLELQIIDPGPSGVINGPPGPTVETSGAIIMAPGNPAPPNTYPATGYQIYWGGTGDDPAPGYAGRPIDATNFAYIGTNPLNEGFTVLATTGLLDIIAQISFIDVGGGSRTFTLEVRQNGGMVGSASTTQPGSLYVGFLTVTLTDLAVVAGDTLTTHLSISELSGVSVPWGTGDLSNRFEILDTSTVT